MDFEAYLISKKIDSSAFQKGEPGMWKNWDEEFKVVHPNSFTAQKLYLINPVRRKYPLKQVPVQKEASENAAPQILKEPVNSPQPQDSGPPPTNPKPVVPRPVFKPKPKMN
jgi:hypothetical protein